MGFIDQKGLDHISQHKCKFGDYTPFDKILDKIYWLPLLSLMPEWLAPNTISLLGAFSILTPGVLMTIGNDV
jgi:hypothetical protein